MHARDEGIYNSATKEENEKLIEKYPFLRIKNAWTGEVSQSNEFTYLDDIPEGWRNNFGMDFVNEINDELIRCNYIDDFRFLQIKEKWGRFTVYTGSVPQDSKIHDIIRKYENKSETTCIFCGKDNVPMVYDAWVHPACFECFVKETMRMRDYALKHAGADELKEIEDAYSLENTLKHYNACVLKFLEVGDFLSFQLFNKKYEGTITAITEKYMVLDYVHMFSFDDVLSHGCDIKREYSKDK